jgi:5-methylcytosine-specific restriction endonuclease McrA
MDFDRRGGILFVYAGILNLPKLKMKQYSCQPCYNSEGFGGNMYAPVLVLNANFEPINVCNTRRAISLILMGKANLVLNGRGEIKTVGANYPRPSIIRLEHMIKRPRPRVKLTKREILRRDDFTCQYCGQRASHMTIDHIIPRHMGGQHTWENLVTACSICNHRKGGRTLDQVQMKLLRPVGVPPASAQYIFGRHLKENAEWEPFVCGW